MEYRDRQTEKEKSTKKRQNTDLPWSDCAAVEGRHRAASSSRRRGRDRGKDRGSVVTRAGAIVGTLQVGARGPGGGREKLSLVGSKIESGDEGGKPCTAEPGNAGRNTGITLSSL